MNNINKNKHLKNKIFNHLMLNGNKKTCEKFFLKSLKLIQKFSIKNHKNLIKLAIINSTPAIAIKQIKKKRKKNIKEFPFLLSKKIRISLAVKDILTTSKKKESKNLDIILKQKIIESSQHKSTTIDKKNALQEYALSKKKYIHYRWF